MPPYKNYVKLTQILFLTTLVKWGPGAYIQVTECLHLQWNFNEHLKDYKQLFNDGLITSTTL